MIAVIKSREMQPYSLAIEGFSRALNDNGIKATLVQYNIDGNRELGLQKIREIKELRPALIFTIGTLATGIAKDNAKETPVLFCMVLNPVAEGLVRSMSSSGNNVTGASLDISPRDQFEILKTIIPKLKTVGVLYSPQESGDIINEASLAAKDADLRLVPKAVTAESDIPKALEELDKEADCLWSISDSVVFDSLKSIQFMIMHSVKSRLPFMGLSSAFVKSGALIAVSCDIEDNGYQAGEQAAAILSGKKPSEIAVARPRKTHLALNLRIAQQIGVDISPQVVARAREVFK